MKGDDEHDVDGIEKEKEKDTQQKLMKKKNEEEI